MNDEAVLLDAIARDPEDAAPYLVYADWLQARGEHRGELIALQGAGDDHPGDHRITDAALEHLRAHAETYLGALAPFVMEAEGAQYLDLRWRHGFIGAATLSAWGRSRRHNATFAAVHTTSPAQALAELVKLESARFMTRLSLGPRYDDRNGAFVSDVLRDVTVPSLRRLWLGIPGGVFSPWSFHLEDLAPLWPRMSELRELVVHAVPSSFGALDLPQLRSATFAITSRVVAPQLVRELAMARWPRLESLQLWHGDGAVLAAIVDRSDLVTLGDLGFLNCGAADGVVEILARSPLAPQLHRLSFARSAFTDAGALALLTNREAFPSLETLDLTATCISAESPERISSFGFGSVISR